MTNKKHLPLTNIEAITYYFDVICKDEIKKIYYYSIDKYLTNLQREKAIKITDICKPENVELFIKCISIYLVKFPTQNIVFNNEYTEFKKQCNHDFKHFAYTHKEVDKCTVCDETTTS
jgi:hypothetical protein